MVVVLVMVSFANIHVGKPLPCRHRAVILGLVGELREHAPFLRHAIRRRGLDRVTRAVDLERQLVLTLVVRLEVLDRVPLEDDLGKPV